ncbi:hypothetical protein [Deinococcus sp. YIM 77859]|uniref:hypothetical protein n=1 Tax=Deinococcus sp. YIM 77859 TaxID=1540221 RepID=UPI001E5CDF81|nr:hypothetical protein [Deinococcus sp. YIM 77859]
MVVSPMLVRDLLLYLRATAHAYTLAAELPMADHLTSLAEELEKAVRVPTPAQMSEAERYLDLEQRR